MRSTDLPGLGVAAAAAALQRRELSPTELTELYLERIEQLNPRLNAYVAVTAERARADARQATAELASGRSRGSLHGVPIALKDLYDTAGIETAGGAKIFHGRVPDRDCTVARRLREAGTVLLGKTNMDELAWGITTGNPHFGQTRNPWDLERIPGGSSGGSGAAIAAGLAAATMGSDSAGSIRVPASLCGVVGLKPTYGRVSKAGVLPASWLVDHAGPLTHTVEDAALILQAVAGYDPADFTTVRTPVDDYTAQLGLDLRGLRVGVPRPFFFERLDDEVRAAVEHALGVLRSLGAEVREVELPGVESVAAGMIAIEVAESEEIHAEALRTRPEDFGADVRAILTQAPPDGMAIVTALRRRQEVAEAARQLLEQVDLLATPTTPIPAQPIGQERVRYGGVEEPLVFALIRCVAPFNSLQLPALSVPCGFNQAGLPLGLQLVGRPFDEATVLRAGHAYEQATDWHRRRPRHFD